MQNGITLITPTGDRYFAFKICEQWMARQTIHKMDIPIQWIVIDDGIKEITKLSYGQDYKKRVRLAGEPPHTLHLNLLVALPLIKYNKIMIIEDDDYYAANYLETMNNWLAHNHMVGQGEAIYYNIQNQTWKQFTNRNHASLCQTGFTLINIDRLKTACELTGKGNSTGIDILFWRNAIGKRYLETGSKKMLIGMKGMPGRRGYGTGHTELSNQDIEFQKLRELMGDDAQVYIDTLRLPTYHITEVGKELENILKMKSIKRTIDGGVILIRSNPIAEKALNRLCHKVETNKWFLPRRKMADSDFIISQRNKYQGKTCYILGKGPGLDTIPFEKEGTFKEGCPIVCANEAIHTVEKYYGKQIDGKQIDGKQIDGVINETTNPLYCAQQDTALGEKCWSKYGTMIIPFIMRWYHNHPRVLTVVYSDFEVKDKRFPLTIEMGILIAKCWGCSDIVLMGCDASVTGICTYAKSIGYETLGRKDRYMDHVFYITRTLGNIKYEYQYPSKKDITKST